MTNRDDDPLTLAAWGAVNAWDDYDRADWPDDAEALNQLAGSLAPWMEALHHVLADEPIDPPKELLATLRDALGACVREDGQGFTETVGFLALATRGHWANEGPSNLDLIAAFLADAVRALVDGQPAPDTDPAPMSDQEFADRVAVEREAGGSGFDWFHGGPATAGPTREQVAETIAAVLNNAWITSASTADAAGAECADAVLALFGRSAPEPPATPEDQT